MAGGSTKICSNCKDSKPLSAFYMARGKPQSRCKECTKSQMTAHYKANRARIREERNAKYDPKQARAVSLWTLYRITPHEYQVLLEAQQNRCAICGKLHEEAERKRLVPDHDHQTKVVRGLLCSTCNTGIGMLQDSPAVVLAAAAYLEKHHGRG
jgi:hypothetical protein